MQVAGNEKVIRLRGDQIANQERQGLGLDLLKGALAGAAAVWVMDRVDWFLYNRESPATQAKLRWVRPHGLDPAHVAAGKLAGTLGKELTPRQPNALGRSIHYSLGVGPGAVYGALYKRVPAIGAGSGMVYGLGLFLAQDEGLNTAAGLSGSPQDYPWQAHARGLIAHLVYGATLDAGLRLLNSRTVNEAIRH